MQILAMELWGDYGLFRKFYTTSSPLTYSIPPPTAIAGILGAITGLSRDEYLDVFNTDTFDVAITLHRPVEKFSMTLNHIETRSAGKMMNMIKQRTQAHSEFLRNMRYKLYIYIKDNEQYNKVSSLVKAHKTHYTISLGLSEMIANFEYVGEFNIEKYSNNSTTEISTAILSETMDEDSLEIQDGAIYVKERVPVGMLKNRAVNLYRTVVLNASSGTIRLKAENLWKCEDGKIIQFLGPLLSPRT